MTNDDLDDLGATAKTLLIPLYYRAKETKRPNAIINDPWACRILDKLHIDLSYLDFFWLAQTATLMRCAHLDQRVGAFLASHPKAIIVNLGCGLDTRLFRIDNGELTWYDLDLPEVIRLRQGLIKPTARSHVLPISALDFNWMEQVLPPPGRPVLIIAEAVLMYFGPQEVKSLILHLQSHFPKGQLLFDAVSSLQVIFSPLQPILFLNNVRLRWGLDRGHQIEAWAPGSRLVHEARYLDQPIARLGGFSRLRLLPLQSAGFRIIQLALG